MAKILIGPGILSAHQYFNVTGNGTGNLPGIVFSGNGSTIGNTTETTTLQASTDVLMSTSGVTSYYSLFYTGTTQTVNKFLGGGSAGATKLNIYSGTRPDMSTITNLNTYASNLLVSFSIPAYSATRATSGMYFDCSSAFSGTNLSTTTPYAGANIYLGVCPTFTVASGTGVATWFWFGNYSSPTNLTNISFVTGGIGLAGSGADLEIADANIVSGQMYKSMGFKFYIPVEYEI